MSEIHPDLFGGETPFLREKKPGKIRMIDAWAKLSGYRLDLTTKNRCGNCKFHKVQGGVANIYHKCRKFGITGSSASDIRVKRTCNFWEAEKE